MLIYYVFGHKVRYEKKFRSVFKIMCTRASSIYWVNLSCSKVPGLGETLKSIPRNKSSLLVLKYTSPRKPEVTAQINLWGLKFGFKDLTPVSAISGTFEQPGTTKLPFRTF